MSNSSTNFIRAAQKKHGDKYTYSKATYRSNGQNLPLTLKYRTVAELTTAEQQVVMKWLIEYYDFNGLNPSCDAERSSYKYRVRLTRNECIDFVRVCDENFCYVIIDGQPYVASTQKELFDDVLCLKEDSPIRNHANTMLLRTYFDGAVS